MPIERLGQTTFSSGRVVVIDRDADEWDERGVLIEDLPRGTFAVNGERAGAGQPWQDVWVELAAGEPAQQEFAGTISVEREPMMFLDESAVAAWNVAQSADDVGAAIERVDDSPTGSHELELAGGRLCLFATSWNEGVFPVYLDRDRAGHVVRVRVRLRNDLADDE